MKSIIWGTITTLTLVALLTTVTLASGSDTIVAGKKGEIIFSEPHRFGETMLPAGHYRIQHRVSGNDHFIHFTELKMFRNEHIGRSVDNVKDTYPEVLCKTEPLGRKASQTAVHADDRDGVRQITRIEVRGENVAHIF